MRLTADEVAAIKACAAAHFGEGAVVRLFGSRVDDALRGGAIDLHVIAGSADRVDLSAEVGFKEALEDRIGDRKVDLIVKAPGGALDTFDRLALASSVVL